jgi:hypothetical protein
LERGSLPDRDDKPVLDGGTKRTIGMFRRNAQLSHERLEDRGSEWLIEAAAEAMEPLVGQRMHDLRGQLDALGRASP